MLSDISRLNHFEEMALFALFVSVALGCLAQRTTTGRIKYALRAFVFFIVVGVGIAWLMYPFSR